MRLPALAKPLTRVLTRAFSVALLAVFFPAAIASAQERSELHMFRYAGTHTDAEMAAFTSFYEILVAKLLLIAREDPDGGPTAPTARLLVQRVHDLNGNWAEFALPSSELQTYWLKKGPLGILYGRVRHGAGSYAVRSTFYLGNLKGSMSSEFVVIDLPIVDNQFDTTRDSHSVVTLYALATSKLGYGTAGEPNCANRSVATGLLNEAYIRAQDVIKTLPRLQPVIAAIIDTMQHVQHECGGTR